MSASELGKEEERRIGIGLQASSAFRIRTHDIAFWRAKCSAENGPTSGRLVYLNYFRHLLYYLNYFCLHSVEVRPAQLLALDLSEKTWAQLLLGTMPP